MALKTAVRSLGIGVFLAGAILSANQWFDKQDQKELKQSADSIAKGSVVMKKTDVEHLEKQITALQAENKKLLAASKKTAQKKEEGKTYTLNVRAGMGTAEVSKLLEKEGIIKNSDEFEAYIINEGKSSSIQLGKSEVNEKMTLNELLQVLTKRK